MSADVNLTFGDDSRGSSFVDGIPTIIVVIISLTKIKPAAVFLDLTVPGFLLSIFFDLRIEEQHALPYSYSGNNLW